VYIQGQLSEAAALFGQACAAADQCQESGSSTSLRPPVWQQQVAADVMLGAAQTAAAQHSWDKAEELLSGENKPLSWLTRDADLCLFKEGIPSLKRWRSASPASQAAYVLNPPGKINSIKVMAFYRRTDPGQARTGRGLSAIGCMGKLLQLGVFASVKTSVSLTSVPLNVVTACQSVVLCRCSAALGASFFNMTTTTYLG